MAFLGSGPKHTGHLASLGALQDELFSETTPVASSLWIKRIDACRVKYCTRISGLSQKVSPHSPSPQLVNSNPLGRSWRGTSTLSWPGCRRAMWAPLAAGEPRVYSGSQKERLGDLLPRLTCNAKKKHVCVSLLSIEEWEWSPFWVACEFVGEKTSSLGRCKFEGTSRSLGGGHCPGSDVEVRPPKLVAFLKENQAPPKCCYYLMAAGCFVVLFEFV